MVERSSYKNNVNVNSKITFYTRFGDYLGLIAIFTAIAILLSLMIKSNKFSS
jgi:hypothetical protein